MRGETRNKIIAPSAILCPGFFGVPGRVPPKKYKKKHPEISLYVSRSVTDWRARLDFSRKS